jgi:RNA polymerase sigma-70 factor (ECF subfamily)
MFPTAHATASDHCTDDVLLRRAVRGDGGAFATLYDRHAPSAYATARRILGPTPAAEDAVQDAMLQLWHDARRYDAGRGTVGAWVTVLARSRALDLLRHENVRAAAAERVIADARDAPLLHEDEYVRREQACDVRARLGTLPTEQRQVLGLLYLGGRTQQEVAGELRVPLGTVKGRTRLGLIRLRNELSSDLAA